MAAGTASCPAGRSSLLPAFMALAFLASLGPALWITALNVKYRDFRYIIPFIVQFGLYRLAGRLLQRRGARQVAVFGTASIPWSASSTASAGVMLGGQSQLYMPGFLTSLCVVAFFLWFGVRYFRAHRARFADTE